MSREVGGSIPARVVHRAATFPTAAVLKAASVYTAVVATCCLMAYRWMLDASRLFRGSPALLVGFMAWLVAHAIMHRGRRRRLARWGIGPTRPLPRGVDPRLTPDYRGVYTATGALGGAAFIHLFGQHNREAYTTGALIGATFGLYVGGVFTDYVRSEPLWTARDVDP